jgi:uncharacterized protein YbgA (DUF1722 family)/uncharacterized protein YbbK (DUF523 family)
MKEHIDFFPVCPEVEIGMGIPRDPVHLVYNNKKMSMIQSSTNINFFDKMNKFSDQYLSKVSEVDGFILKSRSPSCGINSTKIYPKITKKTSPLKKGSGIFTLKVKEFFPKHPIEEDKRLNNVFSREHFFTSIFTIAEFREVTGMKALYNFQGKHKYLFMAYNQVKMRQMSNLVANFDNHPFEYVKEKYIELLYKLFSRRPRFSSNINTQMHIFGYFKQSLSSDEKIFFLDLLEKFRDKLIPISAVNSVLKEWSIKDQNEYLINQSYFQPFPKDLVILDESRIKL